MTANSILTKSGPAMNRRHLLALVGVGPFIAALPSVADPALRMEHVFNTPGTFDVTSGPDDVEYLVVASGDGRIGGAAGGGCGGGRGGCGGR